MGIRDLSAEDKTEEAKAKVALSPELEGKLAEFLKKAGEAKRKLWATRMSKEIERIAKATGLGEEESKVLEAPAEQAAEACIQGWAGKLEESWRKWLGNMGEEEMAVDQMFSQVDQAAQADWFGDYVRPYEHPKWEEGIRRVLSAEKLAVWEKARDERDEAIKKEAAAVLKASVEASGQQQETMLIAKGAAIKSQLALPKERAEKLETLAKAIASTGADRLRKRGEKMLIAMDDVQRQQALKTKRFYVQVDEKDGEVLEAAWKEGVAGILVGDEEKRLKETREKSMARRSVVMGKLMITLLDDRIAFTESQRERLQPIAERLVKDQKSLFDEANLQDFYRLNAQSFFTAGAKANEDELKAILDPNQWQHWKDVCLPKNRVSQVMAGGMAVIRNSQPAAGVKPPASPAEPEDLENALSDYFHKNTVNERKQLLALNLLKAEDAARVAGLAPEALARLETAARGVMEVALAVWRTSTEQNIRSQLQDATAENIKQRLASMGVYSTQRSIVSGSPEAPLWDKTVKSELTEPQQAAWKKELDARVAYRNKAIVAIIMTEFDRKVSLTAEQWTKLEPIIAGKVKDYAPDIESMFSSSYPYSWFLQSYTLFIPIAAIPEVDLKAILSKEQWDGWTGSPEMENTNNYWENVQSRHEQRVKEAKK